MAVGKIVIGGASGFWGDASIATPQLLSTGRLDYLVYDYLAEITMSILARARAEDDSRGYALDFVGSVLRSNLEKIASSGVKVIANAGGVNPQGCAAAIRELIAAAELDLKVGVVTGDDLRDRASSYSGTGTVEMFTGELFPDPAKIASINAYLGAFPIALALEQGADIVVTGRCVDSAVTLGACIHAFGWQVEDYDKLAQGSLAGHLLECGTQATGGNFTDWESVADTLVDAGYPIAEVDASGEFVITKPPQTGGLVTVGTVGEQLLYEIGDPQAYLLPDVACDFSAVTLEQQSPDRVLVQGARGHGAPAGYKASVTWADGFRSGQVWTMYGRDADIKAKLLADSIYARANKALERAGLPGFTETSCEVIGAETHYGAARQVGPVREVDVKIAAKHPNPKGIGIFLKEMVGVALSAPPGLTGFSGARPKPSPVVRLFSMIIPKSEVSIAVELDDQTLDYRDRIELEYSAQVVESPTVPAANDRPGDMVEVPLERLAWGRSGDKGNKVNIGVMARFPEFVPYIAAAITSDFVARYFVHFIAPGATEPVQRFYLPGINAFNFLIHDVLGGGGVASLRVDPQGKGYAQLLLAETVPLPRPLAEKYQLT